MRHRFTEMVRKEYETKPSEVYSNREDYHRIRAILQQKEMRVVGFRPPKIGECFLDIGLGVQTSRSTWTPTRWNARLILEPLHINYDLEKIWE